MLNGTMIEVFADGELEQHPFEIGRLVRMNEAGGPVVCTDGQMPFGVVSRGGHWPEVIIVGVESSAKCKVGAGGPVGKGDRVTSDRDGYIRTSAGSDCFAVSTESGPPGWYVVVRFIHQPDEIADDD
jgi:hypothetical protein